MRTVGLVLFCLVASGCVRAMDSRGGGTAADLRVDAGSDTATAVDDSAAPDHGDLGQLPDLPDLGDRGDLGDFCTCSVADIDGNGMVDIGDYSLLAGCFGTLPEGACADADLNGDALVDAADFGCVIALWGQLCE